MQKFSFFKKIFRKKYFYSALQVVDTGAPSFFWRAHTVTVLLVLICCLVYKGLIETPVEDSTYNGRRGFLAALFFWVTLGMTMMPDGPFLRPHPALWRSGRIFC